MNMMSTFQQSTLDFLSELQDNNNREWFTENKKRYKAEVEQPGKSFYQSVSTELEKHFAAPFSGKVFRIYRDVRFSKDKTPYNTHIRMAWWSQAEPLINPGFYLSLEANNISVGAGRFEFEKPALEVYRNAVVDDNSGQQLSQILQKAHQSNLQLREPDLKKVPPGFDPKGPRAELLKYKGIHLWVDDLQQDIAFGESGPQNLMKQFKRFQGLYNWLIQLKGK